MKKRFTSLLLVLLLSLLTGCIRQDIEDGTYSSGPEISTDLVSLESVLYVNDDYTSYSIDDFDEDVVLNFSIKVIKLASSKASHTEMLSYPEPEKIFSIDLQHPDYEDLYINIYIKSQSPFQTIYTILIGYVTNDSSKENIYHQYLDSEIENLLRNSN